MKKILIVEDDQEISEMIYLSLSDRYLCEQAYSGREAIFQLKEQEFDIILLDLMLPGISGGEAIHEIKKITDIPVIVISALSSSDSIVSLLDSGANDYITKPFDIKVLIARIETQLRLSKFSNNINDKISYGNLTLCIKTHKVKYKDRCFNLSNKELQILQLLMNYPDKIYEKTELYELIWEDEYMYDENTINVHLSSLRKKVKNVSDGYDPIETIWGIGVRMRKSE